MQQAVNAFVVVENKGPVGNEEVVILGASNQSAILGFLVDEIFQRLAKDVGPVNLFVDVDWRNGQKLLAKCGLKRAGE